MWRKGGRRHEMKHFSQGIQASDRDQKTARNNYKKLKWGLSSSSYFLSTNLAGSWHLPKAHSHGLTHVHTTFYGDILTAGTVARQVWGWKVALQALKKVIYYSISAPLKRSESSKTHTKSFRGFIVISHRKPTLSYSALYPQWE